MLKNDLEEYQPIAVEEIAFKSRMLELLQSSNCFERSSLHAHFTASVWLVDRSLEKALLTHHTKLDRWLQIGGHADGNKNLREVALTELEEEAGLKQVSFGSSKIFDIDIHTIPERKGIPEHEHYDVRFLVLATEDEPIIRNHESKAMRWIPLADIPNLCDENLSILRMIEKTQALKDKM